MNNTSHNELIENYYLAYDFRNPITADIFRQYISCWSHPSNKYLDKINNWVIVSSAAVFSVVFSGIDKAANYYNLTSLRCIMFLSLVVVVMSLFSKAVLSCVFICSNELVNKSRIIMLNVALINDNTCHVKELMPSRTFNLDAVHANKQIDFVEMLLKTGEKIRQLKCDLRGHAKLIKVNDIISKWSSRLVILVISVQFLTMIMAAIYLASGLNPLK